MKTILKIALFGFFIAPIGSQLFAQDAYTFYDDLKNIKEKTAYVVLFDKNFDNFNDNLQKAIEKNWNLNEVVFVSEDEAKSVLKNTKKGEACVLMLDQVNIHVGQGTSFPVLRLSSEADLKGYKFVMVPLGNSRNMIGNKTALADKKIIAAIEDMDYALVELAVIQLEKLTELIIAEEIKGTKELSTYFKELDSSEKLKNNKLFVLKDDFALVKESELDNYLKEVSAAYKYDLELITFDEYVDKIKKKEDFVYMRMMHQGTSIHYVVYDSADNSIVARGVQHQIMFVLYKNLYLYVFETLSK